MDEKLAEKKTLKSLLAATRRVLCVEFCMLKFMLPDTPLCVTHTESRAEQHRAGQSTQGTFFSVVCAFLLIRRREQSELSAL